MHAGAAASIHIVVDNIVATSAPPFLLTFQPFREHILAEVLFMSLEWMRSLGKSPRSAHRSTGSLASLVRPGLRIAVHAGVSQLELLGPVCRNVSAEFYPERCLACATDPVTSFSSTDLSRSASCLKYRQALLILCFPSLDSSDLCSGPSGTR